MPAEVGDPARFVHMDDLHSRISSCSLVSLGFVNHYRLRLVTNIQYRPKHLFLIQCLLLAESRPLTRYDRRLNHTKLQSAIRYQRFEVDDAL